MTSTCGRSCRCARPHAWPRRRTFRSAARSAGQSRPVQRDIDRDLCCPVTALVTSRGSGGHSSCRWVRYRPQTAHPLRPRRGAQQAGAILRRQFAPLPPSTNTLRRSSFVAIVSLLSGVRLLPPCSTASNFSACSIEILPCSTIAGIIIRSFIGRRRARLGFRRGGRCWRRGPAVAPYAGGHLPSPGGVRPPARCSTLRMASASFSSAGDAWALRVPWMLTASSRCSQPGEKLVIQLAGEFVDLRLDLLSVICCVISTERSHLSSKPAAPDPAPRRDSVDD